MTLTELTQFFLWCTMINTGLLLLSFFVCVFAGDWVHRIHRRWFAMPREIFNVALYALLGFYKVLIVFFNLIPYVALRIIAG